MAAYQTENDGMIWGNCLGTASVLSRNCQGTVSVLSRYFPSDIPHHYAAPINTGVPKLVEGGGGSFYEFFGGTFYNLPGN